MRTVSEIAKITGLSRRAIRFYDESGLLHPTKHSDSGYRLYDDKALEVLQQILFFKELDVPLKDIKQILNHPNLDKIALLKSHKETLTLKRDRLNNLIELIDRTIENPNTISFKEFDIMNIEKALDKNLQTLKDDPFHQKSYKAMIAHYGSLEKLKDSMMSGIMENQDLVINMYGSIENYYKAMQRFPEMLKNEDVYESKLHELKSQLAEMINEDVKSKKVQEIIAKIDKLMFELDLTGLKGNNELKKWSLKKFADSPEELKRYKEAIADAEKIQDEKYGEGFSQFFNSAVEYYLKNLR